MERTGIEPVTSGLQNSAGTFALVRARSLIAANGRFPVRTCATIEPERTPVADIADTIQRKAARHDRVSYDAGLAGTSE